MQLEQFNFKGADENLLHYMWLTCAYATNMGKKYSNTAMQPFLIQDLMLLDI